MITHKDQVSMMFGREVADQLDAEGLIAPDRVDGTYEPTAWRVYVKDTGNVKLPVGTRRTRTPQPELPANLGNILSQPLIMYAYEHQYTDPARRAQAWADRPVAVSQDFDSLTTAQRQAKMARKVGLETRIVRLALIEIGEEPLQ